MNGSGLVPPNDLERYGITAKLPEVFDHSFTGTYLECERMALYERIWGRAGKQVDYSLTWGWVFHKLAETWIQAGDLEAALPDILEVININIPEETDDRYGRTRLRMQELLIEWVKFRVADPIEILRAEEPAVVICRGQSCPYTATGCDLAYGGRLDQIVRWNAMVGPLDFKTTVMDEDDPISEYKPNHQMAGYIWMTTHLMGSHCWGAIVERLVCNKSKILINRFPIPYPKDMILEWVENERLVHAEIRAKYGEFPFDESQWKQNWGRCKKPYPCRFRDVCTSPREAGFRYRWLRDQTVERRFDFRASRETSNA